MIQLNMAGNGNPPPTPTKPPPTKPEETQKRTTKK